MKEGRGFGDISPMNHARQYTGNTMWLVRQDDVRAGGGGRSERQVDRYEGMTEERQKMGRLK
jgi:hypothetical protein